jgi:uncharacterized membrane protein YjdF
LSGLAEGVAAGRRGLPRFRFVDALVLTNLAVFAALCLARYLPRFVAYRGAGNLHEFYLYAAALFAASVVVWLALRGRADLDGRTLLLIQLGLLLHWLGAFVSVGGGRLYDVALLGAIRYDKLVHFANGGITLVAVLAVTPLARSTLAPRTLAFVGLLAVLGLATLIELMEFGVMSTIPGAASLVGGPADSLPDLLAVLSGCVVALPFARLGTWRRPC